MLNPAVDTVRSALWTLRDEAAQRLLCQTLGDMNPAEIDALVEHSLSGLRSVYVHHVPDPQSYFESIRSRFIEKRVSPTPRLVFVEPHISHLVSLSPGEHEFYFVTDDEPQSVFFDPNCKLFGCAWGPEMPSLRYVDLGFRSRDVLEMASA